MFDQVSEDVMAEEFGETILVVDDSQATLEVIRRNLASRGYRVFTAPVVSKALEILDSHTIDLVITDYKMPEVSGLDLVRHVRENFRVTETMMITGYATVAGAVEAVKTGAEEYLAKPFTDEELFSAVKRVLEKLRMRRALAQETPHHPPFHGIIGESPAMRKIYSIISRAAQTSATVLLYGESGTGKELVARAIHYTSSRVAAPFVPVNCGAIPEDLLESSLFGHLKGSFTGATETRAGFFQTADGGTIFLDEISNTSLSMQAKLLRVLQDKEVTMVGSGKSRQVDVRIISATNKDIRVMIDRQLFREDLFYRLNVIPITIPPLRERENDILLLAQHFLTRFSREIDRTAPVISDQAVLMLKSYGWPGNVRELENLMQNLVVMVDSEIIEASDLPAHLHCSTLSRAVPFRTLEEVESEHIRTVLSSVGGNKTKAAEILGIDRKTLRTKLG